MAYGSKNVAAYEKTDAVAYFYGHVEREEAVWLDYRAGINQPMQLSVPLRKSRSKHSMQ